MAIRKAAAARACRVIVTKVAADLAVASQIVVVATIAVAVAAVVAA